MAEARWFSRGYIPTVKEYLENSWISVGGPAAMVHAYLLQLQGCNLTNNSLDCLKHGSDLIYWSSIITRLADDLGTSTVINYSQMFRKFYIPYKHFLV